MSGVVVGLLLSFVSIVMAAHLTYTGMNEAGLEFGYSVGGVLSGSASSSTSCIPTTTAMSYFQSKGMNVIRIPFRWERVQPTLNGALDSTEWGRVQTAVSRALSSSGIHFVLLDVHNYAQFGTTTIGIGSVTIAAFANLWMRIASAYPNTQNSIIFGLMNEPVGAVSAGQTGGALTTESWLSAVNAAIAAIRSTGSTNLITVPGLGYTGAHSWTSTYYGTPNSQVMQNVNDTANYYVYEIHQYFDSSTGYAGTATDCVDTATIISQYSGVVSWARQYGKKLLVGEFAVANVTSCQSTLQGLLAYFEANTDVFVGWTWWASGACWNNYMFSLEPVSSNQQMSWLVPYVTNAAASSTSSSPTSAANFTNVNHAVRVTAAFHQLLLFAILLAIASTRLHPLSLG